MVLSQLSYCPTVREAGIVPMSPLGGKKAGGGPGGGWCLAGDEVGERGAGEALAAG